MCQSLWQVLARQKQREEGGGRFPALLHLQKYITNYVQLIALIPPMIPTGLLN